MRLEAAKRVGVEWVDPKARADYKRKRAHWDARRHKPLPETKWCYQCGWAIKPGEAYRQRGPQRRIPGQVGGKSNYVCSQCPWAGPLDTGAVLNGLTPAALHLAQLWAAGISQQRVSLTSAWHITRGGLEFHDWWSAIEDLVARGVLRIPVGVNDCGLPPVYVIALRKG